MPSMPSDRTIFASLPSALGSQRSPSWKWLLAKLYWRTPRIALRKYSSAVSQITWTRKALCPPLVKVACVAALARVCFFCLGWGRKAGCRATVFVSVRGREGASVVLGVCNVSMALAMPVGRLALFAVVLALIGFVERGGIGCMSEGTGCRNHPA